MKDKSLLRPGTLQGAAGHNEPKTWTFVVKGYQVEYKSLRKCSLFMYEICKRISAYENARIAFETNSGVVGKPGATVICAITESVVILETEPYYQFARLSILTHQQIQESAISEVFGEFFQPKLKMENYIESPR